MKNSRSLGILILFFILLTGVILWHLFYLRPQISILYSGNIEDTFITKIIEYIYPRFQIEKNRFSLDFFLHKADQVVIRFSLISIFLIISVYTYYRSTGLFRFTEQLFGRKTSGFNIDVLRILLTCIFIVISYDIYFELMKFKNLETFYKPILLLKLFNLDYPSEITIIIISSAILISTIGLLFNFYPIILSIILTILFILTQAYFFSFEKIDHGYATFTYTLILLPFLLIENRKSKQKGVELANAWPTSLMQILVALSYFMSGMEKLLNSGLYWAQSENFKLFLSLHNEPAGLWLMNQEWLCYLLPISALLFQLCFFIVLLSKELKPYILCIGIIFHLSTYVFFGIGGWLNPWWMVYVVFIDWSFLKKHIPLFFQKN